MNTKESWRDASMPRLRVGAYAMSLTGCVMSRDLGQALVLDNALPSSAAVAGQIPKYHENQIPKAFPDQRRLSAHLVEPWWSNLTT